MPNDATKKTALARKNKLLLLGLGVLLLALVAAWFLWPRYTTTVVKNGNATITARLATTPAEQSAGLGGLPPLAPNQGMLFVFPTDGKHEIWMKDMRFAIDIAWLDSSKKVVMVVTNALPSSYPGVFAPQKSSRYVLELPSGTAKKARISPGTVAAFSAP